MHRRDPLTPVDPALEHDYVFSDRFRERTDVYQSIAAASESARRDWPVWIDLAYGDHPLERLDLFPGGPGSPLLIFMHGGYWSSLNKSSFSYVAPPFLRRGFSVAVLGYPRAPAMCVAGIVRSVRKGVRWLGDEGAAHLPDTGSFYTCGHSAGGHLAVMVAIDDGGEESDGCPRAPPVAGCAPLSGIFDLRPLAHTTIAGRIGLDEASAEGLSPQLKPAPSGWLLAGVGEAETPGFAGQTSNYVQRCRSLGADASTLVLPMANHYTVLLELGRDEGAFVQAVHSRARLDPGTA